MDREFCTERRVSACVFLRTRFSQRNSPLMDKNMTCFYTEMRKSLCGVVTDQKIPIYLSLRICFLIASTVGHTVYLDMLCSSSYLYDDCITDSREFKYKL